VVGMLAYYQTVLHILIISSSWSNENETI